jgi:hypothetical protein
MGFLFNRNKSLFIMNDQSTTYLGTDHLSHLRRKNTLSTCNYPFHYQMQCSCLLHPDNHRWPKHMGFLFNRIKSLFVINDYSATYLGTDRLSHLRRMYTLSRCSWPFHYQMQYRCLLHPENYSWTKHTGSLFNKKKLLFVINTLYVFL